MRTRLQEKHDIFVRLRELLLRFKSLAGKVERGQLKRLIFTLSKTLEVTAPIGIRNSITTIQCHILSVPENAIHDFKILKSRMGKSGIDDSIDITLIHFWIFIMQFLKFFPEFFRCSSLQNF